MLSAKINQFRSQSGFLSDPLNFTGLGIAFALNIIHILLVYFKLGMTNATLLVHYNVVYGPDFAASGKFVYLIPVSALVLFFFNALLSRYFYRREKLAAYFLNFSNIALQLIFLAASAVIIIANG